ncbi:MAG TPA: Sir2 family NAD-dependent protein deacetylase [Lentimicrobium sp.]|nr:Sir2 family NAD-dependent protein deacetylase [Lentimicrobium sp.]
MKKNIVVLTGAGISAESGLKTFRDSDGLWEEYKVEEVASYDGWLRNPALVMEFYNKRRSQLANAQPNDAHKALARLESKFEVQIVTQNVDDLHERGGSTSVTHLHGELTKVRSVKYPDLVYSIGYKEINLGDLCEKGAQLRPHIVWFGEEVPLIEYAAHLVMNADYLLIIGTSMQVYPAAGLIHYASSNCQVYLVDPKANNSNYTSGIKIISEPAGKAVPILVDLLMSID